MCNYEIGMFVKLNCSFIIIKLVSAWSFILNTYLKLGFANTYLCKWNNVLSSPAQFDFPLSVLDLFLLSTLCAHANALLYFSINLV